MARCSLRYRLTHETISLMDETTRNIALADLASAERRWQAERDSVTDRLRVYMVAGLSVSDMCRALGFSRATFYRRIAEVPVFDSCREMQRAGTHPAGACSGGCLLGVSDVLPGLEGPMSDHDD
jgi:hypothetical protein